MHAHLESQRPFCRVEALVVRERAPGKAPCLMHRQAINRATQRAHRSLHELCALSWLPRAHETDSCARPMQRRENAQPSKSRSRDIAACCSSKRMEGVAIVRDVSEVAKK